MPGDLGEQTAMTAMDGAKKIAELAENLLKFLFNGLFVKDYDKLLKKEQLRELRENKTESFRAGYVKAKKLQNSKEDISYAKYIMTEDQLKELNFHAKQRGIPISWIQNGHDKNTFIAMYRTKDSAIVEDITEQLIRDNKIKTVEKAMEDAQEHYEQAKDEQDSSLQDELAEAKEDIIREDIDAFNDRQSEALFSEMCNEKKAQSLTFNDTVDRFQCNGWRKEEPYYICKRTNPNNYMEVISDKAEFRGKEYTKHTYNVYVDDKPVGNPSREDKQWTDERFEGRPAEFWKQTKLQMKEAGKFTDDLVVFYSKEDMLEYRKAYDLQKSSAKESTIAYEADRQSFKNDYAGIVNNLKSQMKQFEDIGEYENGGFTVYSGDNLLKLPNVKDPRYVEAVVIASQIQTFEKMGSLSNEIAGAKLQMQINEKSEFKGSEVYSQMQETLSKRIDEMEKQMKEYEKTAQELSENREQIAGIKAERTVAGKDEVTENTHGEENITMEQLKKDVVKAQEERKTTPGKDHIKEHHKVKEDKER